jgi:hypothetical protein
MSIYSNNVFLDNVDIERIAYQKKDNMNNMNNNINTLESVAVSKTESFTDNNKRINDLQDEVLELKQKLKTIYEKEDEIVRLNLEIKKYKEDTKISDTLKRALLQFKNENKILRDQCDKYEIHKIDSDALKQENKMLKTRLNTNEIEDIIDDGDEKINIDIVNLKSILSNRLKTYHEKHIDNLILSYELTDKNQIDKKTIEKLLEEAIHI